MYAVVNDSVSSLIDDLKIIPNECYKLIFINSQGTSKLMYDAAKYLKYLVSARLWNKYNNKSNDINTLTFNNTFLNTYNDHLSRLACTTDCIRNIDKKIYVKTDNAYVVIERAKTYVNGLIDGDCLYFNSPKNTLKNKLIITTNLLLSVRLNSLGYHVLYVFNKYNINKATENFLKLGLKYTYIYAINNDELYNAQSAIDVLNLAKQAKINVFKDVENYIPSVSEHITIIGLDKAIKKMSVEDINKAIEITPEKIILSKFKFNINKLNKLPYDSFNEKGRDMINKANTAFLVESENYINNCLDLTKMDASKYNIFSFNDSYISDSLSLPLFEYLKEYESLDVKRPVFFSLIQSPLGTGKTELLSRMLKNMYAEIKKNNDKYKIERGIEHIDKPMVRVITPRKILTSDLAHRLSKDIGVNFHDYKDFSVVQYDDIDNLALVINSIINLKNTSRTIVIIDELEQVLQQITSSIIKDKLLLMESLYSLIKNCIGFIGVDAYLSRDSIEILNIINKKLFNESERVKFDIYYNTFESGNGKVINLYSDRITILENLKKHVLNGKKIFISCNTKRDVKILTEYLNELNDKIKIMSIHGDNTNDKKVINFVSNIELNIREYDVVIVSPTLTSGVSISISEDGIRYFDYVYGFMDNLANCGDPLNAMQQILRVRYVENIHVWYNTKKLDLNTDRYSIIKNNEEIVKLFSDFFELDVTRNESDSAIEISYIKSNVLDIYADMYSRFTVMRNGYLNLGCNSFISLCHRFGFTVLRVCDLKYKEQIALSTAAGIPDINDDCIADYKDVAKHLKYAVDKCKMAYIMDVYNAKDLEIEEYEKLLSKTELTRKEELNLTKYKIRKFYNALKGQRNERDILNIIALDNNGNMRKIIRNREMLDDSFNEDRINNDYLKYNEMKESGSESHFKSSYLLAVWHQLCYDVYESNPLGVMAECYEVGSLTLWASQNLTFLTNIGVNIKSLYKNPLRVINNVMKNLGYNVLLKKNKTLKSDGKTSIKNHYILKTNEDVELAIDYYLRDKDN